MGATAVLDRHHLTVGRGDLVGTDAESRPERPLERNEKAAGSTVSRRLFRHRSVRAAIAGIPPVRGIPPAFARKHPNSTKAKLESHLFDLGIVAQEVGRDQPGVIRCRRQEVARAKVARLEPLAPGQPGRGQHRVRTGQQHDLGHRRLAGRRSAHGDRPVPADVAGQARGERVRYQPFALGPHAQVFADLVARRFDGGRPGQLDRLGTLRVQLELDGGDIGSSFVSRCGHPHIVASPQITVLPRRRTRSGSAASPTPTSARRSFTSVATSASRNAATQRSTTSRPQPDRLTPHWGRMDT
jgi:hypothetical protein